MLSNSESDTLAFGAAFAKTLERGAVVALFGDLGSGKTTFVKGVVEARTGLEARLVQSPTFTYMNIYEGREPIFHFDLYRLKREDAFVEMGLLDFFEEEGICLIEWPERIPSLLPQDTIRIHMKTAGEGKRRIDVQTP